MRPTGGALLVEKVRLGYALNAQMEKESLASVGRSCCRFLQHKLNVNRQQNSPFVWGIRFDRLLLLPMLLLLLTTSHTARARANEEQRNS